MISFTLPQTSLAGKMAICTWTKYYCKKTNVLAKVHNQPPGFRIHTEIYRSSHIEDLVNYLNGCQYVENICHIASVLDVERKK